MHGCQRARSSAG